MSDKPNPYMQGMSAAQAGQAERSNPYRRHSTDWTRWRGGYTYGKQLQHEAQTKEKATRERAWAQ